MREGPLPRRTVMNNPGEGHQEYSGQAGMTGKRHRNLLLIQRQLLSRVCLVDALDRGKQVYIGVRQKHGRHILIHEASRN
jgi:hypothetical protein